MNRTHAVWAGAVGIVIGAFWLGGRETAGPSSCQTPQASPATVSGDDRRDPVIASDGGGGLVAIWESLTGGPVEASTRDADGTWSSPAALSGPYARDPTVAVDPDGRAIAAWQVPLRGDTTAVQVTTAQTGGPWSTPTDVSVAGTHAREPQIAVTGAGTTVLVWRRDTGAGDTLIEVTERTANNGWTKPQALSDPTVRSKRPRLAVAPNGAAALVWEQTVGGRLTVVAAMRSSGGRWSQQVPLTNSLDAHEPDVAIGPTGAATAAWIEETEDGAVAMATSRPEAGVWSVPTVIGRGSGVPYETPRPGRAETGADVAALPDGRAIAVWTIVDDEVNQAQSATMRAGGVWDAPTALSDPDSAASGVQVAVLAGGAAAAAWEELDGGLIRARVARVGANGAPVACVDLSSARAETGAVRLVGGSAPSAVFVDFNRSRVQVAPIP